MSTYLVQSLDERTGTWATVRQASSKLQARGDAIAWKAEVLERRAKGLVHFSVGVRVVKEGDAGKPFFIDYYPREISYTERLELQGLFGSERACELADAWVEQCREWRSLHDEPRPRPISAALCRRMDELERITHGSPFRKVRP